MSRKRLVFGCSLAALVALQSSEADRAHAGTADISLTCRSVPGSREPVELDGLIPGYGSTTLRLTLSARDASIGFEDEQGDVGIVVYAPHERVLTLGVMNKNKTLVLSLYALPMTLKTLPAKDSGRFRAVLAQAPDPRSDPPNDETLRNVRMMCEYDYSI